MIMKKLNTYLFAAIVSILAVGSADAGELEDLVNQIPALGLVTDSVTLDGFTLENLKFEGPAAGDDGDLEDFQFGSKYVIAYPNQVFRVSLDCTADANVLDNFSLHHLVYGLQGDGAQDCLLHSVGLLDGETHCEFDLTVPSESGVYQLRFCHGEGYCTFAAKGDDWWQSASANSILGIVVVR
jgi:hypothetical protein